jgi:broad specificity phosphatase PhoE
LKDDLPIAYLARHGETSWTLSGQHTGLTDLPLTEHGDRTARRLGERLKGLTFARVFTSPLQRARQTCELAGFGPIAEIDPDLVEWDYGRYEGRTGAEFGRNVRTGTCSATVAPEAKRLSKSAPVRTESLTDYVRFRETCWFSQAGISCVYWRRAGLGSNRRRIADISC